METKIKAVSLEVPEDSNIILGYSHFIKTVEDLNEIIKTYVPQAKYALAFSEASGDRLLRFEGNDRHLIEVALENLKKLSAGHTFLIILKNAFPISILDAIKNCQEVGRIFAATSNPVDVILAEIERGCGILGVIDGYSPLGIEDATQRSKRIKLLREIGYKS
ncbi:MAG: adenosine monophosphate-protein transferase [Thermoplasmatales archaeon]|nr:adenosine monophosphate-protein transferase [Thermoplasmatales archaeon]MCW6169848.1 adenosine monophosphate-protein transferase [Thermoplasmatales archaeon]